MFAAGVLDTSFSFDGKASFNLGEGESYLVADVAVQKDGKTVLVGTGLRNTDSDPLPDMLRTTVVRLNFDGTLDRSFGFENSGIARRFFGDANRSTASAVAIQPDGKIVVVGDVENDTFGGPRFSFLVARYLPNGQLDKSFDGDGATSFRLDDFSSATDVAIQSDGKIVVAGYDSNDNTDFAVVRLHPNGALDHSFDGDGKQLVDLGKDERVTAMAIHQGKIVLVGRQFTRPNGGFREEVAMARLLPNGRPDTGFGQNGRLVTKVPRYTNSAAEGVVVQPDGKVVVAGYANSAGAAGDDSPMVVSRYNLDGSPDNTFGTTGNGHAVMNLGGIDRATDIIQTHDGRFIVGGHRDRNFALVRLDRKGAFDARFGSGGKLITNFGDLRARLAAGPGHRATITGGFGFATARVLDVGANVVSVAASDSGATEGGDTATITVARSERLPVRTRVFFNISGTARRPGSMPINAFDYTMSGMEVLDPLVGVPYVDIPAGQTTATVTLTPRDDAAVENLETATFSIAPNAAYERGDPSSTTVGISDNDGAAATPAGAPQASRLSFSRAAQLRPFSESPIDELTAPRR